MTLEYTLCAVQVEWRKIKGRPGLRLSSFIRRSGGCNCFQFYLNIKSWRTTITLDSSMKILHLLHKSKWGYKALARCWKAPHWVDVPTSILCCCNKIKVKFKKKTERKSGWERLFSVSGAARHSAFSQMHIWKSGHVVGITRVSPRSSSKLALGHRRRQTECIPTASEYLHPVYLVLCSTFLPFLWGVFQVLPFLIQSVTCSLLSSLPICPIQIQLHNRPWTAVSSHWVPIRGSYIWLARCYYSPRPQLKLRNGSAKQAL